MNEHDTTEQAYRNGYEAGYKAARVEIVRCKDCKYGKKDRKYIHCQHFDSGDSFIDEDFNPDDFCSYGERKEDVK